MEDDPFFIGAVDTDDATAVPTNATEEVPVQELIPSMILKELELQPHLSSAVFGYDVQQMSERPWNKPGAVLSDYFNYGFNEKLWRVYCSMQTEGRDSLLANAEAFYQRIEGATRRPDVGTYDNSGYAPPPFAAAYNNSNAMSKGRTDGAAFFKTKMCQRFQEGRCGHGSGCNFAHGAHELRSGPQYQPRSDAPPSGVPPRMPYPGPPMGDHYQPEGGVLGLPPLPGPSNGYPAPPVHNYHNVGAHLDAPSYSQHSVGGAPPQHTGFRMAPAKRDRNGDDPRGGVFDPVLQ